MRTIALLVCALCFGVPDVAASQPALAEDRLAVEVSRFPAPDARQGVAVDGSHLYAIANRSIAKYTKEGSLVARWEGAPDGPIQHLNGGIVREGNLYVAASNYPDLPMVSSIEIWDANTMEHVESISFGIYSGSATWIDYHNGSWWVAFANYENEAGLPGRGVEWTTIERFDTDWRRTGGWVLPQRLIEAFRPYSNSGGVWTGGELWLTGHDAPEIYVVRLPTAGAELELVEIIPAPIAGQGIAVDPIFSRRVYAIDRASRTVVILEVE